MFFFTSSLSSIDICIFYFYSQRTYITRDITATDGGNRSTSVELAVTITNVKNQPPQWEKQSYNVVIPENTARDTPIVVRVFVTSLVAKLFLSETTWLGLISWHFSVAVNESVVVCPLPRLVQSMTVIYTWCLPSVQNTLWTFVSAGRKKSVNVLQFDAVGESWWRNTCAKQVSQLQAN